jgi:hypothetical protein
MLAYLVWSFSISGRLVKAPGPEFSNYRRYLGVEYIYLCNQVTLVLIACLLFLAVFSALAFFLFDRAAR